MDLEPTTLAFEAINFLVLMWLLWRLLYRPLRERIESRRAVIASDLEHASKARAEAEALEAAWRAREAELSALRERTRRAALDEAEREQARILERAREEAASERARVSQLLEAERAAAARWVRSAVLSRGTHLAGQMLRALDPEHLDEALWARMLDAVDRALPELDGAGRDVEVCGARLAERPELAGLRAVLERHHGGAPRITVREDEALIAGWTVRIGDRLFDASIAGELEVFRDLAHRLEVDEAS